MNNIISVNIISGIILAFTWILIRGNYGFQEKKKRRFLSMVCLISIIVITEMITVICSWYTTEGMRIINIIANFVGFSLTPLLPVEGALLCDCKYIRKKMWIRLPNAIYFFICLLNLKTGWIYSISSENEYSRGPLFFLLILFSFYGVVVFVYVNYKQNEQYDHSEKIYLNMLYSIIVISVFVQVICPDIHIIWCSIAMVLLLYYIFQSEIQLKYDDITKVRNRTCFQQRMGELQDNKNVVLIMFDFNSLKEVNDLLGHMEGDLYIISEANRIKECFESNGTIYRIGGDEFCVIIEDKSYDEVMKCINKYKAVQYDNIEKYQNAKKGVAFGYAFREKDESMEDCLQRADMFMYKRKARMKGVEQTL